MSTEKPKILVVDDEPAVVDTLSEFLSLKGCEVNGASSGEEALDLMQRKQEDLVLLDLRLPGIQGTEVARIVKEKYPATKIIIITGYAQENQDLCNGKLSEDLLIKPVRLEEVYNKMAVILSAREDREPASDVNEGVRARLILLKAKVLFIESSAEVYNLLSTHLRSLSSRGENYEIDVAETAQRAREKLKESHSDILLVNSSLFKEGSLTTELKDANQGGYHTDLIYYYTDRNDTLASGELERLTKALELSCFKNGNIEIKWVKIL